MTVRRYQARTLPEALRAVERDCGPDALIVETRDTATGFVVFATRPEDAAVLTPSPRRGAEPTGPVLTPSPPPSPRAWSPGFAPFAAHASSFGVSTPILRAVEKAVAGTRVRLDRAGDPALPGLAAKVLAGLIPTATLADDEPATIALVGPTGVGKTTTLAKLAAGWLAAGRTVAVLTVDTYRIAAVEQLRAYADLLGVPCEVAFTPADLARHVAALEGVDRVLIDTSGRSPLDLRALEALRASLARARPRTVLCLPAGARRVDALTWLDGFERLAPVAAVLTKWDETRAPGEALSVLVERGLPLSHVTIGQEVPDDIVRADARSLAMHALGMHPDQAVEAVR